MARAKLCSSGDSTSPSVTLRDDSLWYAHLLQPTKSADTILGYTLREKIGAGGYGEVWTADAPGGLIKAVKLIFGYHDEGRAQRELKALNRIKQVRHPFLLSLERIDIVDGRLIVVTELAERSLKDRFRDCVEQGEIGIPREELLTYLTDTAEALDFIYESHSLLHLDVKPENLLVVSGHVKLADFGLVKDTQETSISVMGGLTPTYAAPEVFDAQPGPRSDQYSLAIVFQEMLIGKRPFDGTTPAKLALQHLHEPPDVSYLTPGDQGPVRRALAKSPEARFPNCRAFVDELAQRRSRPRRARPGHQSGRKPEPTPVDTISHTVATPMHGITSMAKKLIETKLPPLDVNPNEATFSPTLFIGVGHTATTVLRCLKRRFEERLGDGERRPALRILCLDTDTRDLDEAMRSADLERLDDDEVLPLPLKSPSEYRADADSHLTWLSRRWIYNIPRSRQTEGLRPLGRLAFADHHDKVFDRLHEVIGKMTDIDAVQRTSQLCEMKSYDRNPRVFIVASISGGVGSGMVADLAYTVRMVLAECGLNDHPVFGMLLASSSGSSGARDITVANAYCCLNEIHHYSHVHGYPGDPSCDLPAFDDCPTFDYAYFVDMGNDPLADEYAAMADGLAEYFYLDAATTCGQYFEACREDGVLIDEGMYLHTLGISHSGGAGCDAVSRSAKLVCSHLLQSWLRPIGHQDVADDGGAGPKEQESEIGIDPEKLTLRIEDRLKEKLKRAPLDLIQAQLTPISQSLQHVPSEEQAGAFMRAVEDAVDGALGIDQRKATAAFDVCVRSVAESIADHLADEVFQQFESHVISQLDRCGPRVAQAEDAHQQLVTRIESVAERVAAKQRVIRDQLTQISDQIEAAMQPSNSPSDDSPTGEFELSDVVRHYGRLRLQEFLVGCAKRVVVRIRQQLSPLSVTLADVRKELSEMSEEFSKECSRDDRHGLPGITAPHSVVSTLFVESTTNQVDELVATLDATVQQQCFARFDGFRGAQEQQADNWNREITRSLYRNARALIAARIQVMDFDAMLDKHGVTDERVSQWVNESMMLATPNLLANCGGKSRVAVAVPRGSEGKRLGAALAGHEAGQAKLLSATDGDVTFCIEAGGIPIHQVAALILQSCPRAADIVPRLHSRNDLQWTSLIHLE